MQKRTRRIQSRLSESAQVVLPWQILPQSSHVRDQLRALFDQRVRSPGILVGHVARHCEYVAILFQRTAHGDSRSGIFRSFHNQPTRGHGAQNSVANRKILRRRKGANRKFGNQRPAQRENLLREPRIFLGINCDDARLENRDSLAFRRDRPATA